MELFMKKIFSIFTILIALSTFAFANNINTEIDLSYQYAGRSLNFYNPSGTISENSPVGVKTRPPCSPCLRMTVFPS